MLITFKEFAERHLKFLMQVGEAKRERRRRLFESDDATFGPRVVPRKSKKKIAIKPQHMRIMKRTI